MTVDKIPLDNGMISYSGDILGFKFKIEKSSDLEFETWLEGKLSRYVFGAIEKRLITKLLGLNDLDDRITALENKVK